jgi:hypothetical protein
VRDPHRELARPTRPRDELREVTDREHLFAVECGVTAVGMHDVSEPERAWFDNGGVAGPHRTTFAERGAATRRELRSRRATGHDHTITNNAKREEITGPR